MADDSSCQGKPQIRENLNGNSSLPINLLKPSPDDVNQQFPLEIPSILFEETPLPAELYQPLHSSLSCFDFHMKVQEVCSSCTVDIPSENGNSILPESYQEGAESFKPRNFLTRVLWKQASLKFGGKLMQILMNFTTSRDKLVTEKVHDISNIRWRRCKRTASFDSRKVALLFSILSSVGTLVLIYLTLRVRQRGDGFVLI